MTLIRFRLYRFFGSFWLRRRTGLYARFVESRASGPIIAAVALGGFLLVVVGTLDLAHSPWAAMLWFVVSLPLLLLVLILLTSFGAMAVHSSEHAATPKELLARCQELLEQHGFRVKGTTADGLRCTRGAKALAERDRKSTRLNSSHIQKSRMPSSA